MSDEIDERRCNQTCDAIWRAIHSYSRDNSDQFSILACVLFRLCEYHGMPVRLMMERMLDAYQREQQQFRKLN